MLRFEELYVISDLHLGGAGAFRIFDQGPQLAACVDSLAARGRPGGRVGLVLNGDTVDFLAEPDPTYLDLRGARAKLERIFGDPAFSMVWESLARFVQTPGCTLILTLGNHDVELALPECREALLDRLAGDEEAARGRVVLALDGTGFTCLAGTRRVLCLHGNEVDSFNLVDFPALRRTIQALNRGRPAPAWPANAGTRLVIEVMNVVKQEYPWINLLKPEWEVAVPVLAAIDPSQLRHLKELPALAAPAAVLHLKRELGLLGQEEAQAEAQAGCGAVWGDPHGAAQRLLLRVFGGPDRVTGPGVSEDGLLLAGLQRVAGEGEPVAAGVPGGQLGFFAEAWEGLEVWTERQRAAWLAGWTEWLVRHRQAALRLALLRLQSAGRTEGPGQPDDLFAQITRLPGPGIEILVTGHTHHWKALSWSGRRYFNAGSWTSQIRIQPEMLATEESFGRLWGVLAHGRLEQLEAQGWILRQPGVVAIRADGPGVHAALCRWDHARRRLEEVEA